MNQLHRNVFLIAGLLVLPILLSEQEIPWINYNFIGRKQIKTVKFHPNGLPTILPHYTLGSGDQLLFHFDDLDGDVKDYTYEVIHCNEDWSRSDLSEFDYIKGFAENYLENYEFSISTLQPYTHYWLYLPNEDVQLTKSGNYLLVIYDDTEERELVLVRRFYISEQRFTVNAKRVAPSVVEKQQTHQEIDFTVSIKDFGVRNPRLSITASVMQNGNWNRLVSNLAPVFVKGERLIFDFQDKIIFPGGREFRWVDLTTYQYRTDRVAEIIKKENSWEIALRPDEKWVFSPFVSNTDVNGHYLIGHEQFEDPDLENEYASVLFSLKSPSPIYDHDVYVFGELSDWSLDPEFRMKYNDFVNAYVANPYLKQGYYNYRYVAVPHGTTDITLDETEGSRFETENGYYIMVYFRPFGSLYDRLMAFKYFDFQ